MWRWKPVVLAIAVAVASTGCTTVVRSSVSSDGTTPDDFSRQLTPRSISDSGRYVAFESEATNLVPNDTNGETDVFRHDNQTGETIRISLGPPSVQIAADSTLLAMSGDGDDIAFRTRATLEPGDLNGQSDVYVRSWSTGVTDRVSIGSNGLWIVDPDIFSEITQASFSDDGQFIVMLNSGPGFGQPFLRDRVAKTTEAIATNVSSVLLSGDGLSLVAGALCSQGGTCPHTMLIRARDATDWQPINDQCGFDPFDVSSDGRYIVGNRFGVYPTFTCPEPTGLVRWDRETATFTDVPMQVGFEGRASISNNGRVVAALGPDLRVRVADLRTGVVQLVDADGFGLPGPGPAFSAVLSGNGRSIALTTNSKLVPGDTDGLDDVYTRYSMQPGVTSLAPTSAARGASNLILSITGTFLPGATVAVGGTGVSVSAYVLDTPTKISVAISVDPTAPVGARNVVVSNDPGFGHSDALCGGCLTVT